MQIIPVIDIKAGQVVLAKQGQRHRYRPLSTPLCRSSQIDAVIDAYLSIHTFTHLYIADLDCLMQTGNNYRFINALFSRYPDLNFMLDCGSAKPLYKPLHAGQLTPVIATEAITKQALLAQKQHTENFILSLDFSAEDMPMGDAQVYKSSHLWPERVILMTLQRVGKNNGADLIKLAHYKKTYRQHQFIAAGGVRYLKDLLQIKKIGIEAVLVASALHNGNLSGDDILQLAT